jgi:hypothetical protein
MPSERRIAVAERVSVERLQLATKQKIAEWRKLADTWEKGEQFNVRQQPAGVMAAVTLRKCANELEAALQAESPSEPRDDERLVQALVDSLCEGIPTHPDRRVLEIAVRQGIENAREGASEPTAAPPTRNGHWEVQLSMDDMIEGVAWRCVCGEVGKKLSALYYTHFQTNAPAPERATRTAEEQQKWLFDNAIRRLECLTPGYAAEDVAKDLKEIFAALRPGETR